MNSRCAIEAYLYEGLFQILESWKNRWNRIIIEPNINKEKINILWLTQENTQNYKKVIQINSIRRSTADDLESAIEEVKCLADRFQTSFTDASELELILTDDDSMGLPSSPYLALWEFLRPNQHQYRKVKIREPRIFSLEAFLAVACLSLEKYISEYSSKQLNWRQRELLVIELIEKLFCCSIETPEMTRTEFESNLQTWMQGYVGKNSWNKGVMAR